MSLSLHDGSLRLRLGLFFGLFLLIAGGMMLLISFSVCRREIDTFFDTQQLLFAKTLLHADLSVRAVSASGGPSNGPAVLPPTREVLPHGGKKRRGRQSDAALFFAVYDKDGNCLLHDGSPGGSLTATPLRRGFANRPAGTEGDIRREVWLASPDGERVVVVGQDKAYRHNMALSLLCRQALPWLLFLPICFLGLFWLLGRETAPFRELARRLALRAPQDAAPLRLSRTPAELRPLLNAQNGLFARMAALLERERAFVSDAAHELRTPLAGLRVQAEVVALLDDDLPARHAAIDKILQGMDRCGRLVGQLLALSRLEAMCANNDADDVPSAPPDWPALLREALEEHSARLAEKEIAVDAGYDPPIVPGKGYPSLLRLFLRNALDNAARYTPRGGRLRIRLTPESLLIANSGPALPATQFARVGERFFRPPGQREKGSGLGCSIMTRIARLHGYTLHFGPDTETTPPGEPPQGFALRLAIAPAQPPAVSAASANTFDACPPAI